MRPIYWGIIWFVIGMIGWVYFSVLAGIAEGVTEESDPILMALVYIFGTLFFFSLPIAIIAEIVGWIRRRRRKA